MLFAQIYGKGYSNMKKILILGAALVLLASCQKHFEEEHLQYDETKSKALNIALLTGLTTVEHGPIVDSEPVGHSSNGGQGAAMAAGTFDLLTGGGGLGLTTAFMFKIYQPEWENHVFAWMPQDMAKDETEAAKVMCEIMYKATHDSLSKGAKILKEKSCYEYRAWMDDQKAYTVFRNAEGVARVYEVTAAAPRVVEGSPDGGKRSYYWSYMKTSSDTSPRIGLSNYDTRSFLFKYIYPGEEAPSYTKEEDILRYRNYLEQASSKLPSWVYIYIAPNPQTKTPAYFLNQGKKLYFIKPAARGEG